MSLSSDLVDFMQASPAPGGRSVTRIQLRDYQQAAVDMALASSVHGLIVLPTGSGKSLVLAALAAHHARRGERVLIATHRKELIGQDAEALARWAPDVEQGIYSAGLDRRETDAPVILAGVQSVYRRGPELQRAGPFAVLIVDEAHRIPRDTFRTTYGQLISAMPQARRIGLTATPYRLDSGLLTEGDDALFSDILIQVEAKALVAEGWLAPLVGKGGDAEIPTAGVRVRAGDFVASDLAQVAEDEELVRRACAEIVRRGADRRSWLLFACGVAHAAMLRDEMHRLGIDAGLVTGETPSDERAELLARFRAGRLRCMVNCEVLTTGFDAPCIDLIGLLRPTMSKGLYVQMLGRGMRLADGKSGCRILDFAGNCRRHGDIDVLDAFEPSDDQLEQKRKRDDAAAEFERQLAKHAGEADDFDGTAAEVVELAVRAVLYSLAESRKVPGARNLVVSYRTDREPVTIWLCPEYRTGAVFFARRWFARRGVTMPAGADACLRVARSLPVPERIAVKRDGGFWRVLVEHMPEAADAA